MNEDGSSSGGNSIVHRGTTFFQPIQAPVLKKQGVEAVRCLDLARRRYLEQIKERKSQPGGSDLQAMPLRLGIDPEVFDGQIFLKIYGPTVTNPEAVTDTLVQKWIDTVLSARAASMTKSDLDDEVKKLHMDMQVKDAAQLVVQFFITYHALLRRYNLQEFVKDHHKDAVVHIVSRLQPAELKSRVSSDLEFDRKTLKKEVFEFFEYCKSEAASCERYASSTRGVARPGTSSSAGKPGSQGGDTNKSAATRSSGTPGKNTSHTANKTNSSTATSLANTTRPLPDCLNPSCSEQNFVANFPRTSDADKKALKQA
jgi:hypothetical protein